VKRCFVSRCVAILHMLPSNRSNTLRCNGVRSSATRPLVSMVARRLERDGYIPRLNTFLQQGRASKLRIIRVDIQDLVGAYLVLLADDGWSTAVMSHHLFIVSPSDTPIYSFIHYSTKPAPNVSSPLSTNLPTWSTSAFAGTLTALSGASSATQSHHVPGGGGKMGGGQDRHVIQMIANASLDVVEDVMRKDGAMLVRTRVVSLRSGNLMGRNVIQVSQGCG
jgi:hypothetical protein